jgi:hypothetical protein
MSEAEAEYGIIFDSDSEESIIEILPQTEKSEADIKEKAAIQADQKQAWAKLFGKQRTTQKTTAHAKKISSKVAAANTLGTAEETKSQDTIRVTKHSPGWKADYLTDVLFADWINYNPETV